MNEPKLLQQITATALERHRVSKLLPSVGMSFNDAEIRPHDPSRRERLYKFEMTWGVRQFVNHKEPERIKQFHNDVKRQVAREVYGEVIDEMHRLRLAMREEGLLGGPADEIAIDILEALHP